jgi:hypothetical protein
LGDVEGITGADTVTISVPGDGCRYIEWTKPPVIHESRGCCRLSIRFANQINVEKPNVEKPMDAADHVTGRLKARFSGAENVHSCFGRPGSTALNPQQPQGRRQEDYRRHSPRALARCVLTAPWPASAARVPTSPSSAG